ncbi:ADP-ribosylglycohydrolase family protein [Roseomonas sp. HF4]|uniref:ADP-ribosylglycohydrolase family protein n=1 Tax=Roseomonas sp. HF4 TaxID=2562313 RepID=UPI0010C13291|nr:ADP-ribosylglycohydrolase family protein [Roseomonas sp. HF4]
MSTPGLRDRVRGCLLGGAVGDALGAPVEFLRLHEIRARFGPDGIRDFAPAYGRVGAITDDTQMTLFTAEGLLLAWRRGALRGICHPPSMMHAAYLDWLRTQGEAPAFAAPGIGGLARLPEMNSRRAPGNTCLSALLAATRLGEPARNDSKGCGGVMRVAPCGLFPTHPGTPEEAFRLGCEAAALTHGHVSGILPAGHFAATIAGLRAGVPLGPALAAADAVLAGREGAAETEAALAAARALAARGRPSAEALETLGGGWVAEEALAIAVACALVAEDFADGVRLAANHSGDSDSTAAMVGNLLGALWGEAAIPAAWLEVLELRAEIGALADALAGAATGALDPEVAEFRWRGDGEADGRR